MSRSRIGGSYDLKYVRGSHWHCFRCEYEWTLGNMTQTQAHKEDKDRCPKCGKRAAGSGIQIPL